MSYAMKSGFYEFGMKEKNPIKILNRLIKSYYCIKLPTKAIIIEANFRMIFLELPT